MEQNSSETKFTHLIAIKPLGLLYGSAGGFLSPENLVGRSREKFPPDAPTLSGIFAAHYGEGSEQLKTLQLAGSFWAKEANLQNWYFPTPFNCLVKDNEIQHLLVWNQEQEKWRPPKDSKTIPEDEKFDQSSWLSLENWKKLNQTAPQLPIPVTKNPPWKNQPHLHPELNKEQRTTYFDSETERGKLFLENAIQLEPDIYLIYLANIDLPGGWYRFGGEGHIAEIRSHELAQETKDLLNQPLGRSFTLLSPAVWGTNRFSYRQPVLKKDNNTNTDPEYIWNLEGCITHRPRAYRYRLGKRKFRQNGTIVAPPKSDQQKQTPKLLSRGRYAVPAGTVYVVKDPLENWQQWNPDWFPQEGYSFKRWGCSLALPFSIIH